MSPTTLLRIKQHAATAEAREAIYIEDSDGTELELHWGRSFDEWPHDAEGRVTMGGGELNLDDLPQVPPL